MGAVAAEVMPSYLRDGISLNGTWPTGGVVPRYDSQNSNFSERTYSRSVTVPAGWTGKRIRLEFNAVNHYCEVFINNVKIGEHSGAWIPFSFDITDHVTSGQNFTLRVDVDGTQLPPTMVGGVVKEWIGFNDTSNARCGIVDDVWLRAYGTVHIEDAFIQTSVRNQMLRVDYTVVNQGAVPWTGAIAGDIRPADSATVVKSISSANLTLAPGERRTVTVESPWTDPLLWWPDQPHLYGLDIRLENDGGVTDSESRRFGFREFWVEGTQFRLNGLRVNLRGDWACYSQYWGAINTPAKLKTLYEGMREDTNSNILRWHKHPAPKFAYDMADEMGIMIIAESAFYARAFTQFNSKQERSDFVDRNLPYLEKFVLGLRNNPSIVIWSACNEKSHWFDPNRKDQTYEKDLLERMGTTIEALDTTRPISYDGDTQPTSPIWNRHYIEGYKNNPSGDPYSSWASQLPANRAAYLGEILAVRLGENDNAWWIGIWPRGLRYLDVAGIAPRVYYPNPGDPRLTAAQSDLQRLAYHPIALFDKAYDRLGIAPYKDGILPPLVEGERVVRNLVLYNDDYRDTDVTIRVELRTGTTVRAEGEKDFTVNLAERVEFDAVFEVPRVAGQQLEVVYSTYKYGAKQFEESKFFEVAAGAGEGATDEEVTFPETMFRSGFNYDVAPTVGTEAAGLNGAIGQVGTWSGTIPEGSISFAPGRMRQDITAGPTASAYVANLDSRVALDGAVVTFDFALGRSLTQTDNQKDFQLIGVDSEGKQVFNLTANAMTAATGGQRWEARTDGVTAPFAGGNLTDLPGAEDAAGDIFSGGNPGMGSMTLSLGASGYTMRWTRGTIVWTTDEIPYNEAAKDLAAISFNQNAVLTAAGHFLGNVAVSGMEPAIPGIPTGLVPAAGDGQVELSWTASGGATSYAIRRATSSGGPYEPLAIVATNHHTDTTVANGTTYFYVVSAINAEGESDNSAEVMATPQEVPQVVFNTGFDYPVPPTVGTDAGSLNGATGQVGTWSGTVPEDSIVINNGRLIQDIATGPTASVYTATLTDPVSLNGATVSFDFALRRTLTGGSHGKDFQLIGYDSLGNQVFNINAWAENPSVGAIPSGNGQRWEATTDGTTALFQGGNLTELSGAPDAAGDIYAGGVPGMGTMTLNLSANGYTMSWTRGGISWTSDEIPFNQAAATNLASISFHQNAASTAAGHFLDNVTVEGLVSTAPTTGYAAWLTQWDDLDETNSGFTDNPDGDTLNNLLEYALGGNPTGPSDLGILPTAETVVDGENQWFEYVYRRRINAPDLVYSLAVSSSLESGSWTNIGTSAETGAETVAGDPEFESVTNRIAMGGIDRKFIWLVVETKP